MESIGFGILVTCVVGLFLLLIERNYHRTAVTREKWIARIIAEHRSQLQIQQWANEKIEAERKIARDQTDNLLKWVTHLVGANVAEEERRWNEFREIMGTIQRESIRAVGKAAADALGVKGERAVRHSGETATLPPADAKE